MEFKFDDGALDPEDEVIFYLTYCFIGDEGPYLIESSYVPFVASPSIDVPTQVTVKAEVILNGVQIQSHTKEAVLYSPQSNGSMLD